VVPVRLNGIVGRGHRPGRKSSLCRSEFTISAVSASVCGARWEYRIVEGLVARPSSCLVHEEAGERVPQIVQAHIRQLGALSHAVPWGNTCDEGLPEVGAGKI